MMVRVDSREPKQHYEFLTQAFPTIDFSWVPLPEGDYETDKVLVERKAISDLYGSIIGNGKTPGRIQNQVCRLSCHGDQIVMFLITGSISKFMEDMKKVGIKVDPDIIYGQLSSITSRERIHVIWMENEWDGLITMIKFMHKIEDGKYMVPTRREPDMLMARFLGITPYQWGDLKRKFGSVVGVAEASEKEIATIYGIGKAKSKKIRELLTVGW